MIVSLVELLLSDRGQLDPHAASHPHLLSR